jgi:alpha-glucoside transport system permease protein
MAQAKKLAVQPANNSSPWSSKPVQVVLALAVAALTFFVLWQGFIFLRAATAEKWVITVVAIVWGVGGVAALYYVANWLVELLPPKIRDAVLPYLFIGPAMALLIWFLALPTLRTFWFSLLQQREFCGPR